MFAGDDGGESVTVTPDLDEAVDRELGDLFSETVLPVGDKRSWENKISNRIYRLWVKNMQSSMQW